MVEKFFGKKRSLALVICALSLSTSYAQFNYSPSDTVFCIKPEGIPLYDQLDRGHVLQRVRYGKRMVILDKYDADTFDNIRDHWYKVQTDSAVGYVFGGYLWFMPAPPPGGQVEMYLRRYIPKPKIISKEQLNCATVPPERCQRQVLEFNWKGRKIEYTSETGEQESLYEALKFPGLDVEHLLVFVRAAYRNIIEQNVTRIFNGNVLPDAAAREHVVKEFRKAFEKAEFTDVGGRSLHVVPHLYSTSGMEVMDVEDQGQGQFLFEYYIIPGF